MSTREAASRIKINKLLEVAGWRFFPEADKPANIELESKVILNKNDLDELGNNFEHTKRGFVDFLLLDARGKPIVVLEAKAEHIRPLEAKEQARDYATALNCRFIILSNGNEHYFWDLHSGNPQPIITFPTPDSLSNYKKVTPQPHKLIEEIVTKDYIQAQEPLRPYQLQAIYNLQNAVKKGHKRFLFEMATGTGKTRIAAAVIKLFLSTSNAQRVLFLVDRLELEAQADKSFRKLLDYSTVIYKEQRDEWRRAEVVVTTVQSLLFNNKYQQLFTPIDFDLVISDEAHRTTKGNARAILEYFVGYKLGLTATPRDYLRGLEQTHLATNDPCTFERRLLIDTYRTFGCDNSAPTFRYSLPDGVKDGFLISPTVIDARTGVTTALLSKQGFILSFTDDNGEDQQAAFKQRNFEKRFFSEATNQLFCKIFLEEALRDPISGEIGKSIIFTVSQQHATKIAHILNQIAERMFPGKYQADFALQITSHVANAQQFTQQFAANNLRGDTNFLPEYKTSKTRICVTVGMMTTGYDCPDILNLGLLRPIFSPTDFIQIKGRGTRKHNFLDQLTDKTQHALIKQPDKTTFKLFDFFANCEYFETEFNYDQVLPLPRLNIIDQKNQNYADAKINTYNFAYQHLGLDFITEIREEVISYTGMKIDKAFFKCFEKLMHNNEIITQAIQSGEWERAIEYVIREIFDKPTEYYNLEKLRTAIAIDRQLSLHEILEKIFGFIPRFKSKDELLEEEFAKFITDVKPEETAPLMAIKNYFIAYITNKQIRYIIDNNKISELVTHPAFSIREYKEIPPLYQKKVPEYIKYYVSLDQF